MALGITPIDIVNKGTHPLLVKDNDWERVELNYIAEVQNGYAFSSNLFNHKDGLPLIRIRDIFSEEAETYYSGEYNEDFVVNHKDILIGMDGDFKISRWPGQKGLLNQRVCRLKFNSNYYVKNFLFICVQPYLDAIHSETSAVTVKHLSSRTINEIPLPLPPLPIQRAIVSKIEALFSDLDNGIANFKKAQAQLKIYRQAVLKKAFEGELTKAWREKQSNLPTAEELLKQIKEARQNHYNQQVEDWGKEVKDWEKKGKIGKKPSKPSKAKELPPLLEEEVNELPKLPKSMVWSQLGNVVWSVKDGPHFSPKYSKTGIPFISGGNIRPEKIDFEKVKYISEELHQELSRRCKPEIGDILYTKGGTTGIARVNTYKFDFNVWVHVAVLRPIQMIVPLYLQHVLNSSHCYKQSQKYTHGVGNQDLGLTRMILISLPICSREEQHQIVAEIERRLSVCDKMEQSITESIAKAEALRQSILKKAFEGKLLIPAEIDLCKKEADYEPASVLLEKIKAEKLAKEQAQKKPISKIKK